MEARGSQLSSQETATGLYPEPHESSPQPPSYFFWHVIIIIIIRKSCKWDQPRGLVVRAPDY